MSLSICSLQFLLSQSIFSIKVSNRLFCSSLKLMSRSNRHFKSICFFFKSVQQIYKHIIKKICSVIVDKNLIKFCNSRHRVLEESNSFFCLTCLLPLFFKKKVNLFLQQLVWSQVWKSMVSLSPFQVPLDISTAVANWLFTVFCSLGFSADDADQRALYVRA